MKNEKEKRAQSGRITPNRNKAGNLISYRFRVCVGRDEHNKQVWRSCTVQRPEGLTPAKEQKEVARLADEWEREVRSEYERDRSKLAEERRKVKDKITVVDFIDYWMETHVKDGNHTPDSVAFYKYAADNLKEYFNKNMPSLKLKNLSKRDVLDYLTYMRTQAKTKRGKSYSETTVLHYYSCLRNVLEFAVYVEFLNDNPAKKIKKSDRPRRASHDIDFLDSAEAIEFLACLNSEEEKEYWAKRNGSHRQWQCLCYSLLLTGLRRGELVGLRWKDFDSKNLMFRVRQNVTIDTTHKEDKNPASKIHIGELKGKNSRSVPISKYLSDLLEDYKKEQIALFGDEKPVYIFCRPDDPSQPLYPTEPTKRLHLFIQRHNLPDVSPHDLRHTAGSLAIESGADVKQVQALLGHADPTTTQKFYIGITEGRKKQTVEGIESLLRPKKENRSDDQKTEQQSENDRA